MEFKEYMAIFKRHARVFWLVVLGCVVVSVIWQQNQRAVYQATLLINIGRGSVQNTEQYTYDNFYRLQADERFADTVVRWLGSPRIVEDIYADALIRLSHTGARDVKNIFRQSVSLRR